MFQTTNQKQYWHVFFQTVDLSSRDSYGYAKITWMYNQPSKDGAPMYDIPTVQFLEKNMRKQPPRMEPPGRFLPDIAAK